MLKEQNCGPINGDHKVIKADPYRAPSWCWTSLDGQIHCTDHTSGRTSMVEGLNASVHPVVPVLVDSSSLPPHTFPDLEAPMPDCRRSLVCQDAPLPAPSHSLLVLVDSSSAAYVIARL